MGWEEEKARENDVGMGKGNELKPTVMGSPMVPWEADGDEVLPL